MEFYGAQQLIIFCWNAGVTTKSSRFLQCNLLKHVKKQGRKDVISWCSITKVKTEHEYSQHKMLSPTMLINFTSSMVEYLVHFGLVVFNMCDMFSPHARVCIIASALSLFMIDSRWCGVTANSFLHIPWPLITSLLSTRFRMQQVQVGWTSVGPPKANMQKY